MKLTRAEGLRPLCVGMVLFGLSIFGFFTMTSAWAQVDVWIDPGHGGDKPGNLGFSMIPSRYEKVLALAQSERLETRLAQIGFTTLKTRNGDSNPSLQRRADIAAGLATNDLDQQEPGQMLAIIHMNAGEPSALGTETFFANYKRYSRRLDAYRVDSTFASIIHCDLMTGANAAFLGCNDDRGVKCKPHFVSRRARVPAVYIEVCFSTNQCQEANIVQMGDQGLIANGIAAGISNVIVPGGVVSPERVLARTAGGCAPEVTCDFTEVGDEPDPAPNFVISGIQSLSEGFEGATFPPTGWTVATLGLPVPHRWHRQTGALRAHFGDGAAFLGGESAGAVDEWLISPNRILGASDQALQFYWIGNPLFASDVSAECLIRPVGGSTWTSVWSMANEIDGTEFTYHKRVVDLAPWANDTIEIAFKCAGTNGADFAVDDVAIGDFPPTAAPAHDLCANAITLLAGSFTFTSNTCHAGNEANPEEVTASCVDNAMDGADVFYRVNALMDDTLSVTATGPWAPVVYVVDNCDSALAVCLAASSTLQDGDISTATLSHQFAADGTYYLVVDGLGGDCGGFTLTGSLRGPVTGVGDDPRMGGAQLRLSAAPSPSRGVIAFTSTVPASLAGAGSLRVFDALGRRVFEQEVSLVGGLGTLVWDGRDFGGTMVSTGVYLAIVEADGHTASARVTIVR